jgi:RNA-directed DNA polymerase
MSSRRAHIARGLALAFLAGDWTLDALVERGHITIGREHPGMKRVARLALRLFRERPAGRDRLLASLLAGSRALRDLHTRPGAVRIERWTFPEPELARPLPRLAGLPLPQLASAGDVARFLGLPADELDWFADPRRLNRVARDARLQHYHYRWIAKRSGSFRLIEAPKQRLKRTQRRILDGILSCVPLHDACHGHRRGRSVRTFAAMHVGKEVVAALDLAEFFATIVEARVRAIFASLGYPDEVSALLAGLCCTPTPPTVLAARPRRPFESAADIDERFAQRLRLRGSHLPQGAPTSPALANLAAFRLDTRLAGLARSFGANYGRYADDLAFSGDARFAATMATFMPIAGGIAHSEGFAVRFRKTRVMGAHRRQLLCGLVVNHGTSLPRRELEQLEAILYNCVRHGPDTQNRAGVADFRAHLTGRVAWVAHMQPAKGAALAALLAQVNWS